MKKIVESVIALSALIGIFWGSYRFIDNTYARASEMKQFEQRLDHKILSDQLYEAQKRIWTLDDRYQNNKMPDSVKEEYRSLSKKIEELTNKINNLEKENK